MIVTKATAEVMPVEGDTSEHGEFDVILSTSTLDRDGDELHPDEWKTPLPDHITFDSDHGMSVATTVGSGKPVINADGQLQVRGTFASTPHAQGVRTLVNEGHIRSVSVAFMSHKTKKGAGAQRELLNGAFVAVPANPEAVVLSSKAAKGDLDATLKDMTDHIQAIHDAAVDLGAGCAASNPNYPYAAPNKSVEIKETSVENDGKPDEADAASDDAAPIHKDAAPDDGTADESAALALRARSLAFLIKNNVERT